MGSEGKITVWNHDKIRAESRSIGGVVSKYFDKDEGFFGYNVHKNPFSDSPKFLGVSYWDTERNQNPMGFYMPWEGYMFSTFRQFYEKYWRGACFDDMTLFDLMTIYKFIVWACQNALLANWQVWT